jgi:hypothetical protein
MDGTLTRVIALAREGDMQRRSAALLILSEIGCVESAALEAVGAALGSGNAVLRDFALTYAEKLGSPVLLPYVVPLLGDDDTVARAQAERILLGAGKAGVEAAAAGLARLDKKRRSVVAEWVARQQGRKPLDALVKLLASDDIEAVRQAAHALASASPSADDAWRASVAERLVRLLARESVREDEATCIAVLDLAAVLARPELRDALADLVKASAGRLRVAAARALGAAIHQTKLSAAEARLLLGLLDDGDESVVRVAADLLADYAFKPDQFATLARLATAQSPAARRFALGKMGQLDSRAVVKILLGHLDDSDFTGRSAAQAALKQVDGAHTQLVRELLACDDERRAWVLADIVAARSDAWKRDESEALIARLDESLDRADRLWSALKHVAVQVAAARTAAYLEEHGAKLARQKKLEAAARRLAMRLDLPEASDEVRLSLAICRLKTGRRELTALARRHDDALELLKALDRGAFPLVERLRKTRSLSLEESFYVGFNLAEQPAHRETAAQLLGQVVKQSPRSKIGKAARNKLALLERVAP